MDKPDAQELMQKLQQELAQMKKDHPEEYLDLLKTLNQGIKEAIQIAQ